MSSRVVLSASLQGITAQVYRPSVFSPQKTLAATALLSTSGFSRRAAASQALRLCSAAVSAVAEALSAEHFVVGGLPQVLPISDHAIARTALVTAIGQSWLREQYDKSEKKKLHFPQVRISTPSLRSRKTNYSSLARRQSRRRALQVRMEDAALH
jgi:hypothetical protein